MSHTVAGTRASGDRASGGSVDVKIELVEADVDNSLHVHPELWVRVLSNEPLGDKDFGKVAPGLPAGALDGYASSPCSFWLPDDNSEAEEQGYGFEQWYIFPRLGQ